MVFGYIRAGIGGNGLWLDTLRNWGKWFMVIYLQELGKMVYGYIPAGTEGNVLWLHTCRNWGNGLW